MESFPLIPERKGKETKGKERKGKERKRKGVSQEQEEMSIVTTRQNPTYKTVT